MTAQILAQIVVYATVLSLVYILMSLGLTLVFSIMRMINFAHGELYMLGGLSVYYIYGRLGLNYWVGILGAVVIMFFFGLLLERTIFRPLRHDMLAACLASLGVGMMLQTGALLFFGEEEKAVPPVVTGTFQLGNVSISNERLLIVLVSVAITLALILFIKKSKTGRVLQAVAQNPEAASLQGINVTRMTAVGFGIACALAATAGGIIAPLVYVSPYMGVEPVLKAFIVVIMGGLGSLVGAVIAGFVLGFVEQFSLTMFGFVGHIFGFIIIMVLLLFRPRGFLGKDFKVH
ncbi:MAG: branched-chain amino acid ABC transporter permease [Desulfobacteraceae bacterium]|jgi:branched-chain amino acid transport system permease protein|nr:MAG: branched-chain amino acid ABC transporter permease [Desulfobacteraceae bacterium]